MFWSCLIHFKNYLSNLHLRRRNRKLRGVARWTGPGSHKVDGAAQSMKGGMKSSWWIVDFYIYLHIVTALLMKVNLFPNHLRADVYDIVNEKNARLDCF